MNNIDNYVDEYMFINSDVKNIILNRMTIESVVNIEFLEMITQSVNEAIGHFKEHFMSHENQEIVDFPVNLKFRNLDLRCIENELWYEEFMSCNEIRTQLHKIDDVISEELTQN